MISLNKIKNILWDFDGVLMDSMPVRNRGFEIVLKEYPDNQVRELMRFHMLNGGLSRYVKFRYFFEHIRNEPISEDEVNKWAEKFSEVMKRELLDKKLLIQETVAFARSNASKFKMHIVSGSDQTELRFLCEKLDIASSFISIHGSPTPKKKLVSDLLEHHDYNKTETILIGDSINDYEASVHNGIRFYGYNNEDLKKLDANYIEKFSNE